MMTSALTRPTDVLASFFTRLESMDAVLRIIVSEARIRALMTFRGDPERKVLLDFSKHPVRVVLDDQSRDVDMSVTIRGEVMHDILVDDDHIVRIHAAPLGQLPVEQAHLPVGIPAVVQPAIDIKSLPRHAIRAMIFEPILDTQDRRR